MGLFDFLKSKKKKREDAAKKEAAESMRLDEVDLSGVEPTETRYTQEYQDYLAAQEAAEKSAAPAEEAPAEKEYPVVSPEGFCARFERCSASLIEEPEICDVCKSFCERDATCRWPEQVQ